MKKYRLRYSIIGVTGLIGVLLAGSIFAGASTPPRSIHPRADSQHSRVFRATSVAGLSQKTGVIAQSFDVQANETFADGSIVSPPLASSSSAISEQQALAVLQAQGAFPGLTISDASQASPTFAFGLLTSSPTESLVVDGGTPVWVITYSDVTVQAISPPETGSETITGSGQLIPATDTPQVGTFTALIDATTGEYLRGIAH